MIIKNGLIFDMVNNDPYVSDIRITDGKIEKIQESLIPFDDEIVIDASEKYIYPGLIDAHCHIGLHEQGLRKEGLDVNEHSSSMSPQLRSIDGYNPMDKNIADARKAGITTVCTGPGSANILGGTFMAVKTYGNCVDDVVINPSVAMKCALGENPKRSYDKEVDTRLGIAAKLRGILFETQDYLNRKTAADDGNKTLPSYNMKYEALIPVLTRELPLKVHAHRADDICTALRITKEFDLRLTLEHCTEGYLVVESLLNAKCPVAVGPILSAKNKPELSKKTYDNAAILSRSGISVSIVTDAPVLPSETLTLSAAICVKAGMAKNEALKAITINPAIHIGLADRIGSIEPGKDADIIIANGDILALTTSVETVIIDGKVIGD